MSAFIFTTVYVLMSLLAVATCSSVDYLKAAMNNDYSVYNSSVFHPTLGEGVGMGNQCVQLPMTTPSGASTGVSYIQAAPTPHFAFVGTDNYIYHGYSTDNIPGTITINRILMGVTCYFRPTIFQWGDITSVLFLAYVTSGYLPKINVISPTLGKEANVEAYAHVNHDFEPSPTDMPNGPDTTICVAKQSLNVAYLAASNQTIVVGTCHSYAINAISINFLSAPTPLSYYQGINPVPSLSVDLTGGTTGASVATSSGFIVISFTSSTNMYITFCWYSCQFAAQWSAPTVLFASGYASDSPFLANMEAITSTYSLVAMLRGTDNYVYTGMSTGQNPLSWNFGVYGLYGIQTYNSPYCDFGTYSYGGVAAPYCMTVGTDQQIYYCGW